MLHPRKKQRLLNVLFRRDKKEMHCMTEKQAEAEIRYRLAKFLLFRLQEENLLAPEESEIARQALCKKCKPFTYSLEVDEPWMNGK